MEKPYDIKDLGARLKAKGLTIVGEAAEAVATVVYQETKEWLKDSAKLSKTPYDDMAVPYLDNLDPLVMPKIDKIDGQEG